MTQFCVEEAVFERLHAVEMIERASQAAASAAPPQLDPMQQARDFAEGRI